MTLPIRVAAIAAALHITPVVVLVKRPEAAQALLPGADAYFAREVHLSTPDAHRLHKAVDWSPEDGVLTFYVGRTGSATVGALEFVRVDTPGVPAGRYPLGSRQPLESRIVQLVPGDREVAVAAGANDPLRVSPELHALAAARAHGVASAPAGGVTNGIVGARHDRPAARGFLDHFQEGAGDSERLPFHFHHGFERAQLQHPVPRAAPQLAVEIGLQTSPVLPIPIPRHAHTSAVRLSKAQKRRS